VKSEKVTEKVKIVKELAEEIWREHYTPIIGSGQVNYMLTRFQSESAIASQIEDERYIYYLIYADFLPVGYLSVQVRQDTLFLSKIYILKEHRGQGYAREAMRIIEREAHENNRETISLTVNRENTDSIEIYKSLGFRISGTKVQDIGMGYVMDDYIMVKTGF
jgi:ribosomal protein S18 acetylase RimI-like enzyme